MQEISFRQLDLEGVRTLIQWAEQEGWNPGQHDAEIFFQTDPEGFLGCFANSKMIAGGSIVAYGTSFGFMGLFIVQEEFRSQGIGRRLWHHRRKRLRERLSSDATIGMDGVVDMQDFYASGGFKFEFRDERYERIGEAFAEDPSVQPIRNEMLPDIFELDRRCFGVDRRQFLLPWIEQPGAHSVAYQIDDRTVGFAVMRKATSGYKIGPLFAKHTDAAENLYRSCLNAAKGQSVYLDIPVSNPNATALVQRYNANYVFECGRMYHGPAPNLALDQIYGITTFELG